MPANLPPEARAKLARYTEAKSLEDKIRALEEFIGSVPKHKGTENLLEWARRRLADLREELELEKRKRASSRGGGPQFFVEKSGAAQVVLIGPPNSGKSSVLASLTDAKPEIAPYPFTTKAPQAGMLVYEGAQIQLVDTPPLMLDDPDSSINNRVLGLARNSDAIAVVVSFDDPRLPATLKRIVELLEDRGIIVTKQKGVVRIVKTRDASGVRLSGSGRLMGATEDELKKLLAEYRIYNAIVEIHGDVTLDDVESSILASRVYKPAIVLLNKADLAREENMLSEARRVVPSDVEVIPVSTVSRLNLELVGKTLFEKLGLIRVRTKTPGSEPSPQPLVVKRGTTVIEVAEMIHERLAKNFKYARIWGPSAKYPGQKVGPHHVLEDGDVLEIHAT
ncbi:MAG: GTP-binding protein [Acidilobaceae archaeon]